MGIASSVTNATRIKGIPVDDSSIANGYVLSYNSSTGKLEYTASAGGNNSSKADKVTGAVNGNLAGLDGTGNLTDSGIASAILAPFPAHSGFNVIYAEAGDDIKSIIEGAAAGTLVVLGTGIFPLGDNVITTPDGVSIRGQGMFKTTITSTAEMVAKGAIVKIATDSRFSDFGVVGVGTGIFQVPIGCNGWDNHGPDAYRFVGERLYAEADTDAFYVALSGSVSRSTVIRLYFKDCIARSHYDTGVFFGTGLGSDPADWLVVLDHCDFQADGPSLVEPQDFRARAVVAADLTVRVLGGTFRAGGAAGGADVISNCCFESSREANVATDTLIEVYGANAHAYGNNAKICRLLNILGNEAPTSGRVVVADLTANLSLGGDVTVLTNTDIPNDFSVYYAAPTGTFGNLVWFGDDGNLADSGTTMDSLQSGITTAQDAANQVASDLFDHEAESAAHNATPFNNPSTIMMRDAGGITACTEIDVTTVSATNVSGAFTGSGAGLTGIPESAVTNLTTDLAAKVPTTRTVSAGTGLTGGGALSSNITISVGDAELLALAGLTSAADKLPYFTGSGTAALTSFTSAGRNLIDDADTTAQRATLGLGTAAQQNSTTFCQVANNLSDVTAATARTNLGIKSGSGSLTFTLNNNNVTHTITVTGAAVGDPVLLGLPNDANIANVLWTWWVSATDTVSINANDAYGISPTITGTFKAIVIS